MSIKEKEELNTTDDKNLNYKTLLDRIYMSLPKNTLATSRFDFPRAITHIQGKQTIWDNFSKLAKDLNRDPKQLYKFVMKEISTSSLITGTTLILNGKFSNNKINDILKKYIKQFVLCPLCKKPDTNIITQKGVKMLKCTACGATHSLPRL